MSSTHHLEAARRKDDQTACEAATFLDFLTPFWLRGRTELHKRELQAYLQGSPDDSTIIDPLCHSVSEMASEVARLRGCAAIMRSKEIVHALRNDRRSLALQAQSYSLNAKSFRKNADDLEAGRTTVQQLWEASLLGLGRLFGLDTERLSLAKQESFRAITAEFLVTSENWTRGVRDPAMAMSEQRLCDMMHLTVALPYVDAVVSRDKGFVGIAEAIRLLCPFPLPPVLSKLQDVS